MPGPYRSGYMRSMRKSSRSSVSRKRSSRASAPATRRRRLVSLIKRTVLKKVETKEKFTDMGKTEIYHNCFYSGTPINTGLVWPLNGSTVMPTQGVADNQRVGDEIDLTSFTIKLLIGQKADRPNINWRYLVLTVPKGSSITYANWFVLTSGNVLLDDPNRDFVKIHKQGFWRPNEAGLVGGSADEYTFTKRIYIPYKKHLKFGPGSGAVTHNDDDLYFVLMGYDAFGSLITDNIGYVQASSTLFYRDP